MRPDRETNNAFIYCLAVAAQKFGIRVLFTVAMSNHHHTGIHDPDGNYPAFIEHFHKLFAKCQNTLRGRWENFWSSEQTSVVLLAEPDDVIQRMVYALTNPVKDGLVEQSHHWPGVTSLSALLHGKPLSAIRPRHFFRDDGAMPETAQVSFVQPPGFEEMTAAAFAALILDRIRLAEDAAASERRQTGARILGRSAVLAQGWNDAPANRELRGPEDARSATRSNWSRIEAVMRNRAFRDAYAAARQALTSGVRDVVFPAGTYWLRRFVHALCDTSGLPA